MSIKIVYKPLHLYGIDSHPGIHLKQPTRRELDEAIYDAENLNYHTIVIYTHLSVIDGGMSWVPNGLRVGEPKQGHLKLVPKAKGKRRKVA